MRLGFAFVGNPGAREPHRRTLPRNKEEVAAVNAAPPAAWARERNGMPVCKNGLPGPRGNGLPCPRGNCLPGGQARVAMALWARVATASGARVATASQARVIMAARAREAEVHELQGDAATRS